MGSDTMSVEPAIQESGSQRTRRPTVVTIAVIVTVVVLGCLTWAWHWRTHPEVFPGDGGGIGMTFDAQRQSMIVALTYPYPGEGETISIESATPRVVKNTAEASFDFYVCSLELDGLGIGAIGSTGPREFDRLCPTPVPVVDGTPLDVGADPPQQLVMRVTVHRPGVLRTRGVDLTYSHGWQHGTQAIGDHIHFTSR